MPENKELRINLDYLAKTYGLEFLTFAVIENREGGGLDLVITGSTK